MHAEGVPVECSRGRPSSSALARASANVEREEEEAKHAIIATKAELLFEKNRLEAVSAK